jgi:hypothetical protein
MSSRRLYESRASGRAMTFIIIAASSTVRVIGPACDSVPCAEGG